MSKTIISICLCTFRREHLFETLKSIVKQQLPDGIEIEIIVVNNDPENDLANRIENFADEYKLVVKLDVEPEQNISLARNRTLKLANGDWIAFIDDDEMAMPNWLAELHTAAVLHNADVVIGAVEAKYPKIAPEWMVKSGVFEKPTLRTGTVINAGRTSNALLKAIWVKEKKYNFDPQFGLTGGGDYLFFWLIQKNGGKMISCQEAVVSELVETNRLSMRYLVRRAIRGGEGYAQINYAGFSFVKRVGMTFVNFAKMVILAGYAVIYLPFGRHRYVPRVLRSITQLGKLRQMLNIKATQIYRGG